MVGFVLLVPCFKSLSLSVSGMSTFFKELHSFSLLFTKSSFSDVIQISFGLFFLGVVDSSVLSIFIKVLSHFISGLLFKYSSSSKLLRNLLPLGLTIQNFHIDFFLLPI